MFGLFGPRKMNIYIPIVDKYNENIMLPSKVLFF